MTSSLDEQIMIGLYYTGARNYSAIGIGAAQVSTENSPGVASIS